MLLLSYINRFYGRLQKTSLYYRYYNKFAIFNLLNSTKKKKINNLVIRFTDVLNNLKSS